MTHPTKAPGADSTSTPTPSLQRATYPTTAPSADSTVTPKPLGPNPSKASHRAFATSSAGPKVGTFSFIRKVDPSAILGWTPHNLRRPNLATTTPSGKFTVGVDTLNEVSRSLALPDIPIIATSTAGSTVGVDTVTKVSGSSALPDTPNIVTSSAGSTVGFDAANLESEMFSFEDDTAAEQTTDIDNLVELVKNSLHKRPGSTTSLHDIPIGPDSVEQFRHLYSTKTFHLLRATTTNPQANTTIIVLPDEGYKSVAITANTKTVLVIRFQEGRFTIGHWVLVRVDLEDETIYYHDSLRQPDHVATPQVTSTCDEVKELLKKSREFRRLSVIEFNPEVKRCCVSMRSIKSLVAAFVSGMYLLYCFGTVYVLQALF